MQGKWVDFSTAAINRSYDLVDDDSEGYMALFQNTYYHKLMRVLTRGTREWTHHPSMSKVTTFQMKTLTPVAKVWYNFLCAKVRLTLHLLMVTRDKTILLYYSGHQV